MQKGGKGWKGANSGRREHKSDGHPKVPRNTKQKKDRALAGWLAGVATPGKRISERESGRLFSNNLPRDVGGFASRGSGFPALEVEVKEVVVLVVEEEDAGGGK